VLRNVGGCAEHIRNSAIRHCGRIRSDGKPRFDNDSGQRRHHRFARFGDTARRNGHASRLNFNPTGWNGNSAARHRDTSSGHGNPTRGHSDATCR
jgi:hypothetical protein